MKWPTTKSLVGGGQWSAEQVLGALYKIPAFSSQQSAQGFIPQD